MIQLSEHYCSVYCEFEPSYHSPFLSSPLSSSPLSQAHAKLAGKDKSEAMEEVIQICRNGLSYEGIFFDVEVSLDC